MKELEYPFDPDYILSNKKTIKKRLCESQADFTEKKIAVLGGYTTNDILLMMELFLMDYGIKPVFYESGYNQFYQEAVFGNATLEEFNPDIIYICTSNRNVTTYPVMKDTAGQVEEKFQTEMGRFCQIWEKLTEQYHCPIIQNNFEMPYYRLLGNRDAYDVRGAVHYLTRLNMGFYEYAQRHTDFYICDLNYISADYGLKAWSDPFYWYMYKYAVSVPAIPYLSFNVANIIKSLFGKNQKGFVLDLDNTLWGGVIGDDGVDNIALGPEEPEGEAYLAFQKYIRAHQELGVIFNINSKNDYENAAAGLHHPDSVLTEKDFIVIRANWETKDRNFAAIASELNLLPHSLVFVDDNPAERSIVTGQFPQVRAPDIGRVTDYICVIDRSGFFEATSLSTEDQTRGDLYRQNKARQDFEASFAAYGDYLSSLHMAAVIEPFEQVYITRITQLVNKSNQFNLTTKRYTQPDIVQMAAAPGYITLYGRLTDKFGDNGIVSVVIGRVEGEHCHIDLWLMSCRVLKRDMESAMMDALAEECGRRGVRRVVGYYFPTAKNRMVEGFYKEQGFAQVEADSAGNTVWELDLAQGYQNRNQYIERRRS